VGRTSVRQKRARPLLAAAPILAALILCLLVTPVSAAPLTVATVNHPLQALAERIAGDRVEVLFPLPEEGDPAEWRPNAETVARFQAADLVLLNGAGYARWTGHVSLSLLKLVDTSAGFRDRYLKDDGPGHSHGPGDSKAHRATVNIIWLDLGLAVEQARAIARALAAADPEGEEQYRANLAVLETELLRLDDRLRQLGTQLDGRPMVFSHPVYHYFRNAYGINGRALHWEPDVPPDAAAWRDLDALLVGRPARLLVWEGEPDPATLVALEAKGLTSVVFKPAANRDPEGDFLAVMAANIDRLDAAVNALE